MQRRDGPSIDVAARTDVGHVRERNEDSLVVGDLVVQASQDRVERLAIGADLLVAALDGVGGHPDGDVASRLAAEALVAHDDHRDVRAAVLAAHHAVLAAVGDGRGRPGMGSTIVMAAVVDDEIRLASAGDSPAYAVGEDGLHPLLPTDRAGFGGITAFLGDSMTGELDPHVGALPLDGTTRLLLATDGLTDELTREQIHTLAREGTVAEAADALVEGALAAGGRDNVTVVVTDVAL